jgi:hypothetical protein
VKARARTKHPELGPYPQAYKHHDAVYYRPSGVRGRFPLVKIPAKPGTPAFDAAYAVAERAHRAWCAYFRREVDRVLGKS